MSNNTQLVVIPADLQLPAHLQTPDAAAAIAQANAAAAGGIKGGSFPRISKKGGKFHIVDGDEMTTLMNAPSAPGQPALPMMMLEAVVIAANPSISKTYYEDDFQEGERKEPDCKSSDGIKPDSTVLAPQHPVCATCPKNQWGSKISKMSGKESKACTDVKQTVLLPRKDLKFKALGFAITPSELKDWGGYVKALSGRNIPVTAVQTNITFDATASHPKCLFSFGGMLTADEYAQVTERAKGDDVKVIIEPIVRAPALPAPTQTAATQAGGSGNTPGTRGDNSPESSPPAPAAPPASGFGGAGGGMANTGNNAGGAPAAPSPEQPKRTRSPRKPPAEAIAATAAAATAANTQATTAPAAAVQAAQATATDPLAHLPPEIKAAVQAVGPESPAGKAIMAQYPRPAAPAVQPTDGTDKAAPPAPVAAAPIVAGFGSAPVAAVAAASVGMSLRDKLAAKLAAAQKGA